MAVTQSKVFISYSRRDLDFVDQLAAGLESHDDFHLLIDRSGIGHGDNWQDRLGRMILECDTMVFVLSPDSIRSDICTWGDRRSPAEVETYHPDPLAACGLWRSTRGPKCDQRGSV